MRYSVYSRLRGWLGITSKMAVYSLKATFAGHLMADYFITASETVGPSMLPTLNTRGDYLIHMPLPFFRFMAPFLPKEIAPAFHHDKDNEPQQTKIVGGPRNKADPAMGTGIAVGDLVAVCSMRDASYEVCKRVIGLAGDTILIDPRSEVKEDHHLQWTANKSDSTKEGEPRYIVIPPGHIWLTGDNMANSTDSRDYGPVPLGMIRGRVIARVSTFS